MASIDDPEFAPPRELPFPAGTSRFRQKGQAYLTDFRFFDAVVRGGHRAVIDALPDPGARTFFRQELKRSEWYDAYPGTMLETTAARVRGMTFEQHRRSTGIWHAEDFGVRGIYAALLKMISNENIAMWAPRISSLYFEFGKTETRVSGPKEVAALRRGIPEELVQWLVYASAGFAAATRRLAGARDPRVTLLSITPDGRDHSRDLVKVDTVLGWK